MTRSFARAASVASVLFCVMGVPATTGAARGQENTAPRHSPVIGAAGVLHGVETLEKSLEYYQKVLGFELVGPVAESPMYDVQVQALTNHGGVLYRRAMLKIPGSAMTLQLFEGVNGQVGTRSSPRQTTARPTDPGGAMLGVRVPAVATIASAIESSHQADVLSAGGALAGKTLFARNRDGFVTEITETDHSGSQGSGVDAASFVLTAAGDVAAKLRFYTDVLGFDLKAGEWESGKALMDTLGVAEMGMVRRNQGYVPGTKIPFEIDEYRGITQKRAYYYFSSTPGAVTLQLLVRDIDDTVKRLRAAQVRIVTTGQQPVTFDHARSVLVRDPEGLYVQLMERVTD